MNLTALMPYVRHFLQFAFGLLTGFGILNAENATEAATAIETIVGAVGSLATVVGYAIAAWKAKKVAT